MVEPGSRGQMHEEDNMFFPLMKVDEAIGRLGFIICVYRLKPQSVSVTLT